MPDTPAAAPEPDGHSAGGGPDYGREPSPLTILAVDDSEADRESLAGYLEPLGHTLIGADSLAHAREVMARETVDLILLKLGLPDADSPESGVNQLRPSDGRWVPLILCVSFGLHQDWPRLLDSGADDFLVLPLDPVLVRLKIRAVQRWQHLHRVMSRQTRYQAILDSTLEGIITIDERGIIDTFNRAAERIFGYRAEEMIGERIDRLVPASHAAAHGDYILAYLSGDASRVVGHRREIPGRRRDGSEFPMSLGVTEIRDRGRRLFVGVFSDVTAQVEADREMMAYTWALENYRAQAEAERETARQLMERALDRESLRDPLLNWQVLSSDVFSGDVVAALRGPDRTLHVMLGDAMGHGLSAAVILLPALGVFHAMTRNGFRLEEIVAEMNRRLNLALPTGTYLASVLIAVDERTRRVWVWNGGMPEGRLLAPDGAVETVFPSRHPPLGLLTPERFDSSGQTAEWHAPAQLFFHSDGLSEATSPAGKPLGEARLAELLTGQAPADRLVTVAAALVDHLDGTPAHDDVAMLSIDLPGGGA